MTKDTDILTERWRLGLTLREAAAELKIDSSRLSDWELHGIPLPEWKEKILQKYHNYELTEKM